jgi:hypothetical protein
LAHKNASRTRRERGGKILFRRGCKPIRRAIGIPRHPDYQDAAAARLVDARSPRLVAEGETLKQRLCNSVTHCPRTTVLSYRESLASVFEADASGGGLAQPTLELVRKIEVRGLP